MSGSFDLDQTHGLVQLDSHDLKLDAPRLFGEPLALGSAAGVVTWDKRDGRWRVAVDDLRFAGAPVTGTASGTWTAKAGGPGTVDLNARLAGASVDEVNRYMPVTLDPNLRAWLKASIGRVRRAMCTSAWRATWSIFRSPTIAPENFSSRSRSGTRRCAFLPEWPPIEGLDADLKFEGARMTIDATRGRSLGAEIGPTKADIPNLSAQFPVLTVVGDATGPTSEFLQYIAQSPVATWIGHATEGAISKGTGKLQLKLSLPLGKEDDAKVAGEYQFIGNELHFPDAPALDKLSGRLSFTERDLQTHDVAFEALGGPAKVAMAKVDGQVRVVGSGTANLATLRHEFEAPLLDRVSGTTDWELDLTSRGEAVSWALVSSMKGAVIDLPAPIGKAAVDAAPLKLERRELSGSPNEDQLTADYRGQVRVVAHRGITATGSATERVLLLLGSACCGRGSSVSAGRGRARAASRTRPR